MAATALVQPLTAAPPAQPAPPRRLAARPARRMLAPPPAAGLMGSLRDTMLAANAEALARKEGGLVGAERGLKPLPAVPVWTFEDSDKAAQWASVLQRQGCLGLQGALSPATAAQLLQFVVEENARCQAAVEAGEVEFDARFGGVNCR